MQRSSKTQRRQADQLRTHLLAILAQATAPMTTAELREHLSTRLARPIVIEPVYRNLCVLADRGEVQRVPTRGRHTQWSLSDHTSAKGQPAAG